ncbi:hypothetical protein [Flavonifractor sp. AGMB03687]|uniref:hypothetical protein n=1 Tax=Flavonifractor sp. AGMB03687 TaxID=2785133 RepID=UPI001ADF6A36|nr:hypothetical protein [Flavonifractor sp. AGMB03687]
MYNRYIPNGTSYTRIPQEDAPTPPPREEKRPPKAGGKGKGGPLGDLLKSLKLDSLDTGDVLLLLILLFLFLEGDDMELVITLALVLLLGLS